MKSIIIQTLLMQSQNISRLTKLFALGGLMLLSLNAISQEVPSPKQSKPIAIIGATVHPVSGDDIPNATLLFENGKIKAIGTSVSIPQDAERIDAKGKHVYPALINAFSSVGLQEIGAVDMTVDLNETGLLNPNIRAEVAVNAESQLIPTTRANGVLISCIYPRGGLITGTAAAIELDGWTWEEMTLRAPLALAINFPRITPSSGGFFRQSREEQIKTRDRNLKELAKAFADARAYLKAKDAESTSGTFHETDVRWEAMRGAIERKIPVHFFADEESQIEAAVAFAEREKLRAVIIGGYDAWKLAPLLNAKKIPVVVTKIHRLPSNRSDAYDALYSLPKKLYDLGVNFCIADNGSGEQERNLPYNAGTAAAYGLPKAEALKAITLSSAKVLGIDDRVGSLEVGKDATLFLSSGDPLEILSQVEMAFIQGKRVELTSKHTRLYEKYKKRYGQ
ncbi:MAG: amidohydrolase family protein [Chloroherpetonaceae bacterium]|nr:amidohydrolase family protein [Chloroherpetonaceae bacterium]